MKFKLAQYCPILYKCIFQRLKRNVCQSHPRHVQQGLNRGFSISFQDLFYFMKLTYVLRRYFDFFRHFPSGFFILLVNVFQQNRRKIIIVPAFMQQNIQKPLCNNQQRKPLEYVDANYLTLAILPERCYGQYNLKSMLLGIRYSKIKISEIELQYNYTL